MERVVSRRTYPPERFSYLSVARSEPGDLGLAVFQAISQVGKLNNGSF